MDKACASGDISLNSEETNTKSNPLLRHQTNILAMALTMKIDPPLNAPAIREKKKEAKDHPFSQSRKSVMQTVAEKSSASGDISLDSEETSTKQSNPLFRPQTNILAMSLCM
jgi:hypothetical protein